MSLPGIEDAREAERWAEYFAVQLTPEEKAAGWDEVERAVEQAARDGVYERAKELKGKIRWSIRWYQLRLEE